MWLRLVRRLRSHGLLVHRSESSDGIQIYKLESGNVTERRLRSALIATAWLSPVHSVHSLMSNNSAFLFSFFHHGWLTQLDHHIH